MTLILTLGVTGVLAWAVQTKNYAEGFLAIAALGGIASTLIGSWAIKQDKPALSIVLIAIGVAQCFTVACFAKKKK
jgi:hypothetical protein